MKSARACENQRIGRKLIAAVCLVALAGIAAASPTHTHSVPKVLGRSALGRPILLTERGPASARRRVIVVGCIHGDECAGIAITKWLEQATPEPKQRLWILQSLNPDGYAAQTRQNGRGVDLNRNFPWRWRTLDQPGGLHYAGPHPLSEPEARLAKVLIKQVRPQLTIWFHQPLGVVDDSGGNRALERRYARLVGLPLVRLPRYPGSAACWQNHLYLNTSFVVELPPGPLTHRQVARYGDGILDLAG